MQEIKINELKPHPRNNEFFDNITGDKWQELLDSIKKRIGEGKRGNIEPIVITQDKVIVAGHQRVRAFEELGISTIDAEIRLYDSDDEVLLDLLESNIRRRGDVGGSAKKMGLRIRELERLYGIHQGNGSNQHVQLPNNSVFADEKTKQEQLATQLDISVDTIQNYKLLADMIPELSDLVDTGIVTKTTALAMMKNLSGTEQKELIDSLPSDKKYTQRQMDEEIQKYKNRISELIQNGTKIETVEIHVDKPETLDKIKSLEEKLDVKSKENTKMSSILIEKEKIINQAIGTSTNYQLVSHCSEITLRMLNFVKEMSQYDYMAESFNEIPNATRIEYEKCIKSVKKWADRILETIDIEKNIIEM
ncbi:ParB N-terminal domain-containing protein [Clostridium sp. HBUAS56010]|uniref:ParB/RepB/Spo0J family partition protein n=1 Tax=Clostridium sp. HBUAS56010 TaxID=2571127 RepID=UPI0011779954|nr:ParB N-terminal domain-containing protein [Clostridium sp. HBUAS56010]